MYTKQVMQLYNAQGARKYLNQAERIQFYNIANKSKTPIKLFCLMLYWTGGRISEVLNLQVKHLDFSNYLVAIECLKKRKKGVYRQVPLSHKFLNELKYYIRGLPKEDKLWQWSRRSASRYVKKVMILANLHGAKASSKGLRHSFAIHCISCRVPLPLIKKWLGHQSINTTAIYLDIVGVEERAIAKRIWRKQENFLTRFYMFIYTKWKQKNNVPKKNIVNSF